MKKEYDFKKGRRGPVLSHKGKTRITIFIDNEILADFRERADDSGRISQYLIGLTGHRLPPR